MSNSVANNVVISATIHTLKAILQVEVIVCTTIRDHLMRNRLYNANLLYIMQQCRERGEILAQLLHFLQHHSLSNLNSAFRRFEPDLRHLNAEQNWTNESKVSFEQPACRKKPLLPPLRK